MSHSIKKNTLFNFVKTLSSIVFPLITFPYVSRVLQPENIGKYNWGNTYVNYFSLLASLGVTTYAIRECSRVRDDKKELGEVSSQIFSINVITTIFAYIILFSVLFLFPNLNPYKRVVLIQSVIIIFTTLGADWINSAMEDFAYITIRTVVFQIISLLLMFIFVHRPEDYLIYAAIGTFSSSGANIMNMLYRRRFCRIRFTFHTEWRKHLKPIMLLFVMLVAQTIFSNSDVTMLGLMRTDYETGLYSTASKVYNLLNQLMASILWVVLPRLSNYYADKNYKEINPLLKKSVQLMAMVCLPCLFGVSVLSKEILRLIGGQNYIEAWPSLIILMGSLFFSLIGGSFIGNMIMLPSKREIYFVRACVAAAFINIGLNFLLIPHWGANGAAFTTLLAHVILYLMMRPYVEKEINIGKTSAIFSAPLIGGLVILIWCIFIKKMFDNFISILALGIIGGASLYFGVLILMKYEFIMPLIPEIKTKILGKWKK